MSVTMRRTKTLGAVPMTEQAVWGVGSAGKPRAPSQRPVPRDSATPTVSVTDNVGGGKNHHHPELHCTICLKSHIPDTP